MDEQIEDLTPNQSPSESEEPWCSTCHAFTDYRRKSGIPFNGQIWTVDPIPNIEVPTVSVANNPCFYYPPAKISMVCKFSCDH